MEKHINNFLWGPAASVQIATLSNLSLSSSHSTRKRGACWRRSVMHKLPHEKHDHQQLLRGRGGRRCLLLGMPQKCPPMYFRAEHRPSLKPCSPETSQYPRTRVAGKLNPPPTPRLCSEGTERAENFLWASPPRTVQPSRRLPTPVRWAPASTAIALPGSRYSP